MLNKEEIKAAVAQQGCSLRLIGTAIEKHPTSVSRVADRTLKSKFIADAIAKVIGLPTHKVFSDVPEYQPGYTPEKAAQKKRAYWAARLAS